VTKEIETLIKLGYANRLMLDDWPGDVDILKPAMKGYESNTAPWEVRMEEGCTFWKEGKCELHNLGLKPMAGRYAHHSNKIEEYEEVEDVIRKSWETKKASNLIEKWKIQVGLINEQYI
jgi:hypothetical protein